MLIAVLMIISEMQVMADIQVNQPKEPPKQEQSKDFYQTQAWKKLRYKVLCKYEATCQCCGRSRREGQIMHVDHILPRSKFPELELDIDNLQVLCEECNLAKSNIDTTDWRNPE